MNAAPTPAGYVGTLLLLGAGSILVGLVLFWVRPDFISVGTGVLAVATIWIGLVPTFIYALSAKGGRPSLPLLPLTGIFYACFFGLPVFLLTPLHAPATGKFEAYSHVWVDSISVKSQLLVLVGFVIMLAAYEGCERWRRFAIPPLRFPVAGEAEAWRLKGLLLLLLAGHIAYLHIAFVREVPSIGQVLLPAGGIAYGTFYVFWLRGQLPRWLAGLVFLVSLPVLLVHHLVSGVLTPLVMLSTVLLLLTFAVRQRLPVKSGAALALCFLLIYPVAHAYRSEVWKVPQATFAEKLRIIVGNILDPVDYTGAPRLVRRLSHILVFNHVISQTPEPVPYWDGATYKPLVSSWIPRALWPSKPEERAGNVFAHRYGLVDPGDRGTSVNIPWITEMYANFGAMGVLAGMFLVGVFLSIVQRSMNRPEMTPLELGIAGGLLVPLAVPDSNFSVMTGSLIPIIATLWLYFFVGLRVPLPRTGFLKQS